MVIMLENNIILKRSEFTLLISFIILFGQKLVLSEIY